MSEDLTPVFDAVDKAHADKPVATRLAMIKGAAGLAGGIAAFGALGGVADAKSSRRGDEREHHHRSRGDDPQTILNIAATAEVLATIVNTIGSQTVKLDKVTQRNVATAAREELIHYNTLVSIGGYQSNHTRQVAAVAAHLGLACRLVQEKWVPWDDPTNDRVGNILLSRIMGADVRLSDAGFDIGFRESWEDALKEVEARGGKPYPIPAGASDHPLGGHGFAGWAGEVAAQEAELGVFFDTIVVCSVTGSTQAGMIAGFAGQERERSVLGIDGSATVQQTWEQIARIARRTAEAIGLGRPLADEEIVLLDEWHAGTYGIPDAKTIEAIRLCARLEGMLTDPVYEGKSMAALIDLVRDGRIAPGSKVLYAHLGGQPALNGYAGAFEG